MPTRARKIAETLRSSKSVTRLLKVLNRKAPFDAPEWDRFRRERIADLEWLWNPRGNPPAAKNIYDEIMGVGRIPHPRYSGAALINAAEFGHDESAIEAAFACLHAIQELVAHKRVDLISRCRGCGDTYLFDQTVCNPACKARAHRTKSRSKKVPEVKTA
jgi:hypothetical protein